MNAVIHSPLSSQSFMVRDKSMEKRFIYADNAATTRISDVAFNAMLPYLKEKFGNASSVYGLGRESKNALLLAREKAAKAIGANVHEILFTSGGTEADNLAIRGCALLGEKLGKKHIVTSAIEHSAVLDSCRAMEKEGFEVTVVPVNPEGFITADAICKAIKPDTHLVSIMTANNEIGTIQPIAEIGKLCRESGILFHTDAVQAVGNMKIDVKEMNIDLMSVSGHKIHAPKGVGCLYCRKGIELPKLIHGGHQERNKRAGTENVAFIAAFGQAIEEAVLGIEKNSPYIKSLRDRLYDKISDIPDMNVNGSMENRLPGNLNLSFGGIEGESLILSLDMHGICVSSGAACASGSLEASHVLRAIGLDDERARGSVRITLNEENSFDDVDYIAFKLRETVERLRKLNPNWNFR